MPFSASVRRTFKVHEDLGVPVNLRAISFAVYVYEDELIRDIPTSPFYFIYGSGYHDHYFPLVGFLTKVVGTSVMWGAPLLQGFAENLAGVP